QLRDRQAEPLRLGRDRLFLLCRGLDHDSLDCRCHPESPKLSTSMYITCTPTGASRAQNHYALPPEPVGQTISTACIMPMSSWANMWQCITVSPVKSRNRVRKVTDVGLVGVPFAGSPMVSAQYGSTGAPLILTTWNGLTWMWNGCRMRFMLSTVHSSTLPSATVCLSARVD